MAELKLTWDDLLIQNRTPEEYREWLAPWRGYLTGRMVPIALNRFGCWFLRRPDGTVEMFDVLFGESTQVAGSSDQFSAHINDPAWQATYLLSESVYALHQAGQIAHDRSCYAIAPPPRLGGPDPWELPSVPVASVMIIDVAVWQSLCSQLFVHPGEGTGEPGNA